VSQVHVERAFEGLRSIGQPIGCVISSSCAVAFAIVCWTRPTVRSNALLEQHSGQKLGDASSTATLRHPLRDRDLAKRVAKPAADEEAGP